MTMYDMVYFCFTQDIVEMKGTKGTKGTKERVPGPAVSRLGLHPGVQILRDLHLSRLTSRNERRSEAKRKRRHDDDNCGDYGGDDDDNCDDCGGGDDDGDCDYDYFRNFSYNDCEHNAGQIVVFLKSC